MKRRLPGLKWMLAIPLFVALLWAASYFHLLARPRHAAVDPDPYGGDTLIRHGFHQGPVTEPIDSILVVKRYRHMYVYHQHKLLKVYHICLGEAPVGPKHFQGDRKTPEGLYHINDKNPQSIAHRSLGISYPNDADRRYARSKGQPTGGDVKIHGTLNGYEAQEDEWAKSDWTWGCIAVKNREMDEIYDNVVMGAPINILP